MTTPPLIELLDWPLRGDADAADGTFSEGLSGMGRRSRMKRERRRQAAQQAAAPFDEAWPAQPEAGAWTDDDGLHTMVPGEAPTPEQLLEMSRVYQQKIRSSPLWQEMVDEFGPEKAEAMLKDFRVQLR